MRGTLDSRLKTFNTMPDNAKSARKAAATKKRGMLSARVWEDLCQASRLAHAQGVTLFMHGVKIVPQERYVSKEDDEGTLGILGTRGKVCVGKRGPPYFIVE